MKLIFTSLLLEVHSEFAEMSVWCRSDDSRHSLQCHCVLCAHISVVYFNCIALFW